VLCRKHGNCSVLHHMYCTFPMLPSIISIGCFLCRLAVVKVFGKMLICSYCVVM